MKKLLVIILALVLIALPLVSCNSDTNENPVDTSATSVEQTTEAPTTEVATEEENKLVAYVEDPLLNEIANKIAQSESYLIFSIGDSLTEGQGAPDGKNLDYTAMFTKKLGEQFPEKSVYIVDGKRNNETQSVDYPAPRQIQKGTDTSKVTVVRSGFGGHTVKKITQRSSDFINKKIKGETGNLFIICSGINDSTRSNLEKYATPPTYKKQLSDLVDMIYASHPDADVILMTPTYVGNDGSTIAMYAQYMRNLAQERQIALIDLNKLWMDHWVKGGENYGQGDWLNSGTNDSCHPSDIGHEAIADEMIRCIFGTK